MVFLKIENLKYDELIISANITTLVEEVEENLMQLEDLIEEQETEKKILDAKVQFIIHRYYLIDIISTVIAIVTFSRGVFGVQGSHFLAVVFSNASDTFKYLAP
jgi:hypothetical protein